MLTGSTLIVFCATSVFLLCSAFFSASETALFSIPRERIFSFRNSPKKRYLRIFALLQNGQQTLLMILLGNIFVNITVAGLINSLISTIFKIRSEFLTLAVATVVIVLFGEIIPKNIALKHNESIARIIAPLLYFLVKTFRPVLKIIQNINNRFLFFFKFHLKEPSPFITIDELKTGIEKSISREAISSEEGDIIKKVLDQGPLPVRKYMIHRSQLLILPINTPVNSALMQMQRGKQNVALVKSNHKVLTVKGFVRVSVLISASPAEQIGKYTEEPVWVPETTEVAELTGYLLQNGIDECCLFDEYGGFSGMFSVSAALSDLFGGPFEKTPGTDKFSKSMMFSGAQELHSIIDLIPDELRKYGNEYRTVNGVLTNYLGRIPRTGETFAIGDFNFYIISSSPTRIESVLIQKGENS